jgi:hypothetical protein
MNSLDINQYTTSELLDILKLYPGYSEERVNEQCSKLKHSLSNNITISDIKKNDFIEFIDKIANVLKNDTPSFYLNNNGLVKANTTDAGGTFLIEKPITKYDVSFSQKNVPGILNPLEKRVINKNINIDTRFRDNYYSTISTNFNLDLPFRMKDVISMTLSSIEIPLTFYSISTTYGNNYFYIIVNKQKALITIPSGNYSQEAIISFINTFLVNLSKSDIKYDLFKYILFTFDQNVSINGGSFKTIVSINSSYTGIQEIEFELDFVSNREFVEDKNTALPLKFGWKLGFREGRYLNNVNYVSEGILDMGGSRYLYLVINDFNNNVNDGFYGAFNSSILNKNILARIGLYQNPLVLTSDSALSIITDIRLYFGPVVIQKLQIQLLDEYGQIIDLNNMDFSFVISLQTNYNI